MAVSVQFEIGHTAKLRTKKTPEGFTHDWDLYVRGSNKADISAYVDKVVFNLHESFPRPKRVIKEPPYAIHESGYAGFILNIDIYFRNRDEPKRVQYAYDLDLQQHGPPHHRSEERKFLFENPSEEFRQKLLKGGGVPVVPAGLTGSRSGNPNILPSSFSDMGTSSTLKHKSSNSNLEASSSSKKHKSRNDDSKLNTFADLFGTPDTSAKSSANAIPKTTTETLKTGSGSGPGKMYSPSSTGSASSNNTLKEKSSKEGKEKSSSSSSVEKSKDKSERKEKHKSSTTSSPNKEGRSDSRKSSSNTSGELGKSEKRSEDKPKKDKSRDKERDRSRSEQSSSGVSTSSNIKPSGSNKPAGSASTTPVPSQQSNSASGAVTNTSAQRTPTQLSTGVFGRTEEREPSVSTKSEKSSKSEKSEKSEKETKEKHSSSSSSGKKSKKDKKDKDKDKDRDKEKRNSGDTKSKDDRSHINSLQSNMSNSPSGQNTPNSLSSNAQLKPASTSSKKSEKDIKLDNSKGKSTTSNEKSTEKHAISNNSVPNNSVQTPIALDKKATAANTSSSRSTSATTKTHKHKKRDKNKDKDKDRNSGGDKEKDKSKDKQNKEKPEEKRETEKPAEIGKSKSPELKKTLVTAPANLVPPATTTTPITSQSSNNINTLSNTATTNTPTTNESTASSKKSQSKEKKSKDSKSSKDSKRRSESTHGHLAGEPKNKVSKTSTPLSTAGSNIELSDADSHHSTQDTNKQTESAQNASQIITEAPELLSDSSYSSFPDIPVRQTEKPSTLSASTSPEKGSSRASTASSKENKQREKEKPATKPTEKPSKTDKEEKKRRRIAVTASSDVTKFVEPPIKQVKKEQNKTTPQRDSTKSPLPRNNSSGSIGIVASSNANANNIRGNKTQSEINNQDDETSSTPLTTSPNAIAPALSTNSASNHTNNVTNHSTQQRTTPLPASPALNNDTIWPNLSELQELHRKIMTLQDNDDLQQVVEMIAASGCYELTQRTFDFDLCKLDRSTVERLQEFFATSVS